MFRVLIALVGSLVSAAPSSLYVPGHVQERKLIDLGLRPGPWWGTGTSRARPARAESGVPVYPKSAKLARVEGTVRLMAAIAPDGIIQTLKLIHGHPLLVNAALDTVRHCVTAR